MAELVNLETGAIESVSDHAAVALLSTNEYRQATALDIQKAPKAIAPSEDVNVVGPYGEAGTVPREQLIDARKLGYQPEAPEATQERRLQTEYGDQYGRTAGEALLRGGSLGLSDILMGDTDKAREGLRERRERNAGLAAGFEAAGAIGSTFIGGAPANLATRAGAAAGRVTERALLGGATKGATAAARYAPAVVRGGAEGALFGVGSGISNVALSEDPMSAEAALGEIGSQALLGAGIGGVAGAAGQFLSDSTELARKHVQRLTRPTIADDVIAAGPALPADAARIAQRPPTLSREARSTMQAERDAIAAQKARPEGFAIPDDAKVHQGIPDPSKIDEAAIYAIPADDLRQRGTYEWEPFSNSMGGESKVQGIRQGWEAGSKVEPVLLEVDDGGRILVSDGRHRVRAALDEDRPIAARLKHREKPATMEIEGPTTLLDRPAKSTSLGQDVIEDFKGKYHRQDTASRQQIRQWESLQKRDPDVFDELKPAAEELERARREMRKFLPLEPERSYESLLEGNLGGSYARGQGKSLQTWTGTNDDIAKAVRSPGFQDAARRHQDAIDDFQELLGNKSYPPIIGDHPIFQSPPAAITASPEAMKVVSDLDARFAKLETALSKEGAAAAKAKHYAETVALAEKNGMSVGDDVLNAKLREAGLEGFTVADVPAAELTRLKAEVYREQVKGLMASAKAKARAPKAAPKKPPTALEQLMGDTLGEKAATMAGGAIGSALGVGPWVGGLAGRAILGNPLRKITEALSGKVGSHMSKIASGVDSFLAGAGKVAKGAPRLTGAILSAARYALDDTESEGTPFEQRSNEISQAIGNEQETKRRIHDALAGVRTADAKLGDDLEDLAWRRIQYLYEVMPKNPGLGSTFATRGMKWTPTDSEQAKWARCVDTAEHPEHVLEDMARGFVTKEQVEALQAIYPTYYQRIRQDIVLKAAEIQKDMPWGKRLLMSTMFGVPTDNVLKPESVASMQETFIPVEPPGGGPQMPSGQQKTPQPTRAQSLASGSM